MAKQILILLLGVLIISCKAFKSPVLSHELISIESDSIFQKLVKLRRDFHQYPEISAKEKRTQKVIKTHLLDLGLEIIPDTYGNSIIGLLRGDRKGKNIAWRADMDAIRHDFPSEQPFRSIVKGVQHGCGHDVHMAIALGIAEVFSKYRNSLYGNVYFIFQPEEETFMGAKAMVENDVLSALQIDEIFALHVTAFEVGKIIAKPNEMYAYQKRLQLSFNKSMKKEDAFELYEDIKAIINRIPNDNSPRNVSFAFDDNLGLSNRNTIFNDYCFLDENPYIVEDGDSLKVLAFLYETDFLESENIIPKVKDLVDNSTYKKLLHSISFVEGRPTVMNAPGLTNKSLQTLVNIYGEDLIQDSYGQVPYFNDDFCYFQNEIPGVYFLLGASNKEKGLFALNHAPNFAVDEECIRYGVKSFSSLLLERMNAE